MTKENKADEEEVLPAETEEEKKVREEAEAQALTEQDPLKTELDKIQRKSKRTPAEKLLYSKKRIDQQLKELGIEDESDDTDEDDEDNKPVTVGMLKKIQSQSATKTALQMADEVDNETERELLRHHLENTINSTGDPQQDFRLAQTLVNAVKNKQITEEVLRKPNTRTNGSGGGAPVKTTKQEELTPDELSFMRPPFNLTKAEVIAARPK